MRIKKDEEEVIFETKSSTRMCVFLGYTKPKFTSSPPVEHYVSIHIPSIKTTTTMVNSTFNFNKQLTLESLRKFEEHVKSEIRKLKLAVKKHL